MLSAHILALFRCRFTTSSNFLWKSALNPEIWTENREHFNKIADVSDPETEKQMLVMCACVCAIVSWRHEYLMSSKCLVLFSTNRVILKLAGLLTMKDDVRMNISMLHQNAEITICTIITLVKGHLHMSHLMTKPTKWHMCPAKTQMSLDIRPVWLESSLCAQWVAKDPRFLHADSEDSDQTARMQLCCSHISFPWRGSYLNMLK